MGKSPPELLNKDQLEQTNCLVTDKAIKTTNLLNDTNDKRNQTDDDYQAFHITIAISH
jgi:hypothetical protein